MLRANSFWAWWLTPVVPELGGQGQEDCVKLEARVQSEFWASLSYKVILCLKQKQTNTPPKKTKTKGTNGASKNSLEDRVSLSL